MRPYVAVLSLLPLMPLAAGGVARAEGRPLSWDKAFSSKGAPRGVHFKASYTDAIGRPHALELWRDGEAHLRRRTDDAIDLLAEKTAGGEIVFRLVDLGKKRLIEVSRTNLHRIGIFASYPELAGVLIRPAGSTTLGPGSRPKERAPAGACRWVRVETPPARPKEICWSERFKLPLLIQEQTAAGGFTTLFQIHQIEANVPAAGVFRISTKGLTVIHADQEIDPSSDM